MCLRAGVAGGVPGGGGAVAVQLGGGAGHLPAHQQPGLQLLPRPGQARLRHRLLPLRPAALCHGGVQVRAYDHV